MVGWYSSAPHVDIPWPEYADQPSNNVLDHTLKHLMKDVRGDRKKDVREREIFPEWMVHRFQPSIPTSMVKCLDIAVSQNVRIEGCTLDAGRERLAFAKSARGNSAFGAASAVCASYERLLRVVANENGENGMTTPPDTIAAHHCYSSLAVGADRGQNSPHTCVE